MYFQRVHEGSVKDRLCEELRLCLHLSHHMSHCVEIHFFSPFWQNINFKKQQVWVLCLQDETDNDPLEPGLELGVGTLECVKCAPPVHISRPEERACVSVFPLDCALKICLQALQRVLIVHVCVAGSTVYTCMLNKRGGAEADLTVSRLEPGASNLPLAPESNGAKLRVFVCVCLFYFYSYLLSFYITLSIISFISIIVLFCCICFSPFYLTFS